MKLALAGPPKISQASLARYCGVKPPPVFPWKNRGLHGEYITRKPPFPTKWGGRIGITPLRVGRMCRAVVALPTPLGFDLQPAHQDHMRGSYHGAFACLIRC